MFLLQQSSEMWAVENFKFTSPHLYFHFVIFFFYFIFSVHFTFVCFSYFRCFFSPIKCVFLYSTSASVAVAVASSLRVYCEQKQYNTTQRSSYEHRYTYVRIQSGTSCYVYGSCCAYAALLAYAEESESANVCMYVIIYRREN